MRDYWYELNKDTSERDYTKQLFHQAINAGVTCPGCIFEIQLTGGVSSVCMECIYD
jgi:hypothetical protein